MLQRWSGRLSRGIFSGIIAGTIIFFLFTVGISKGFFYRFEAASYDWRVRKLIEPAKYPNYTTNGNFNRDSLDVVIVSVDGRSLNELGSFYQWSRTEWAKALDILKEANAGIVGMDILFDKSKRFPAEDDRFVAAVRSYEDVFNAMVMTQSDPNSFLDPMASEPEGLEVPRFIKRINDLNYRIPSFERFEPNFPALMNAGSGIGAVNLLPDDDDIIRRISLFIRFNENIYPTFAFGIILQHLDAQEINYDGDNGTVDVLRTNGETVKIPVDNKGRMLIHYLGPYQTFRYISFYSLLNEIYETQAQSNALSIFKDKIVLMGSDAPGLYDLRPVPRQYAFPGVEIHANVIQQIIDGNFIQEFSTIELFWLLLLVGLIAGMAFSTCQPLRGAAVAFLQGLIILSIAIFTFDAYQLWMPLIAPLGTIFLTYAIHYAIRYSTEEKDKKRIRGIFSQYVSPRVVDELLRAPENLKLGGEKRVCTVLFSDLARFTNLAEATPPEQLISLLNEYLNKMTHVVHENNGTLDKYGADGIMVLFGAPTDIGNHASYACRTALEMNRAIESIREDWRQRNLPEIHHRIGVNTGQMIIGNLGSDIMQDYTAIGDSVNLAARLEGANKLYGSGILIAEDTYQMAKEDIWVRQLDLLRVKGKREPVKVYELIAMRDEKLDIKTREALSYFQQGYEYYLAQNWDWAMNQFRQVLQIKGEDEPSRLYLLRCQAFMHRPPGQAWDGVYTLRVK